MTTNQDSSAIEDAKDLIKTTVMLSSGSFILTGNLMSRDCPSCSIKWSIFFFFISIVFGLISLMYITGLRKDSAEGEQSILNDKSLQYSVWGSIIFFGVGCLFLLVGIIFA